MNYELGELCRLLDEQGLEWREHEAPATDCIAFFDGNGWHDCWESVGGEVNVTFSMTPEQAIAATLGRGTCRNVAEPDEYSDRPFTCSECGARGPMGNGTYHMASSWAMKDGTLAFADSWPVWKYCPACGAKVVDPTTNDVDAEVDA
jgi:hypothetical protein